MFNNRVDGLNELVECIKEMEKLPQRFVTKAAKAGATVALKAAKANAPKKTGNLVKGIILRGEKLKRQGKKVYDVMMDPAMNSEFVKISKEGHRSYYPASIEFGFVDRGGSLVAGQHFLRNSIDQHADEIETKTIDVLLREIDKAWAKEAFSS